MSQTVWNKSQLLIALLDPPFIPYLWYGLCQALPWCSEASLHKLTEVLNLETVQTYTFLISSTFHALNLFLRNCANEISDLIFIFIH